MKLFQFVSRNIPSLITMICLSSLILQMTSCSKDGSGKFKLDNAMYFTILTGAKSYSTFGYTNTQVKDMFGGPELTITFITDSLGKPQTRALLIATENIISGINTVEFTMGDCAVDWYVQKPDNGVFGNYQEVIGLTTSNTLVATGTTGFYLDKTGLNLVITKQDIHNGRNTLEGTFTATLRSVSDTTQSQPATGSFRAYVN
jgi:hypothetical protein